jgi:hypothetical protein
MKRSRFSEEQIIGVLKEHETACSGMRIRMDRLEASCP